MMHAASIIRCSKKLHTAQKSLLNEPAIWVRFFSRYCCASVDGALNFRAEGVSTATDGFNSGQRAAHVANFKMSLPKAVKGNLSRTRMGATFLVSNKASPSLQPISRRCFSSDSGLPSHQEIGMPSLSPTMTEGNIARWVKKEGDKVSPGEVLCEVETDKATVEMECMEEGYLAKIIHGDGAQAIKVGEVIAITVEEEDDIEKFKDYKVSASTAADEVKGSADPMPSKKEASEPESLGLPSHQEIGMPSLSPTMTEGNIARWVKKVGDKVLPGEVLCEVETDKATVEMECMEEGYLAKIIHGDGAQAIKVGEVIAIIVEEDDIEKFKDYEVSASTAADEVKGSHSKPKVSKTDSAVHGEAHDRISTSPLARKSAQDHNVPLSSIKGTGPEGRIVKADIDDYLASSTKSGSLPAKDTAVEHSDLTLSQIRKVTAARLLLSKQTIPHYYLTVDVCANKLMDLRGQLNSLQEASGGNRISVNDLVIKAAALALREVPQCNSSWMDDYIRLYRNININVAVQTDDGLFVPVIKDADKKGLSKISEEVKYLAQKATNNSLKPEDYEGGTFTVSNLGGPFGISQFCAIVNPPQAAILAVGSAEKRLIPSDCPTRYEFAPFISVTLSCDHRVIDGAIGAQYLKAFKGYIENPQTMLL